MGGTSPTLLNTVPSFIIINASCAPIFFVIVFNKSLSSSGITCPDSKGDPDPAEQVITFTAHEQNLDDGDYTFTTIPNVKSQTGASNEFTLNLAELGNNENVKVTVAKDGLTNYVTVFKLKDGV